jgi:hypothetical protein
VNPVWPRVRTATPGNDRVLLLCDLAHPNHSSRKALFRFMKRIDSIGVDELLFDSPGFQRHAMYDIQDPTS